LLFPFYLSFLSIPLLQLEDYLFVALLIWRARLSSERMRTGQRVLQGAREEFCLYPLSPPFEGLVRPLGRPPTYNTDLAYPPLILLLPLVLAPDITLPALPTLMLLSLHAGGYPG